MGQRQKTTWIGFIRHFGAEVSLAKSWAPALGFKLGAPDGDTRCSVLHGQHEENADIACLPLRLLCSNDAAGARNTLECSAGA